MFSLFKQFQRSLQLKKEAYDRTITEFEKKATEEETLGNEVIEDLVRERQGIERKLLTSYSLGRDQIVRKSKSLLPISRSYSFQSGKKVEHSNISDQSSSEESESTSEGEFSEEDSSGSVEIEMGKIPKRGLENPNNDERDNVQVESSSEPTAYTQTSAKRNMWLKRRTFSLTH